jgi:aminomethyltransferase
MSVVGRGILPASFLESARRVRRMRVPGGGVIAVGVRAGDELRIVDPEGLQPGLLYAISEKEGAQAVIPALDQHDAPTLDMALAAAKDGKPAAANAVGTRGIAAEGVRGARLLGQEAPGAEVRFAIGANGLLLVFAPGEDMAPDAQNPATELLVEIAHDQKGTLDPPPPLAEPKLDLRVDAATASAYRVKAGDYIHIIDVADGNGRARPGPSLQVFRSDSEAARGGRAGYRRPARHLHARLQCQIL